MFKLGDKVECSHNDDWRRKREASDRAKAIKLGKPGSQFIGNAAAYMHADEAYVVEEITKNGGLKLRGFVPTVSVRDVKISLAPTYPRHSWWRK